MLRALLASAVFTAAFLGIESCWHQYPYHASCDVKWTVGMSCADVQSKLLAQMAAWVTRVDCPLSGHDNTGKTLGEKCLYKLISNGTNRIDGHHYTPVENYSDTFNFQLSANGPSSCNVAGHSSSDIWYAYLDLGTNYCNVANLVYGSGMAQMAGFTETAEDCTCTQYSSRNCTIY